MIGPTYARTTTFMSMMIRPLYSKIEREYMERCEQTFLHGILKNINGSTLSHGVKESLTSFYLSMIVDPAIADRKFVDTG